MKKFIKDILDKIKKEKHIDRVECSAELGVEYNRLNGWAQKEVIPKVYLNMLSDLAETGQVKTSTRLRGAFYCTCESTKDYNFHLTSINDDDTCEYCGYSAVYILDTEYQSTGGVRQ